MQDISGKCESALSSAFHLIHVHAGRAFQWQLEKRGKLPEKENASIQQKLEKAKCLVYQLNDIGREHFLSDQSALYIWRDMFAVVDRVLLLSHLGNRKQTLAAWYYFKEVTLDRGLSFWTEACILGREIDEHMRSDS
jgi:hypothetical protein